MGTIDKAAIGWSIGIVLVAVGIAALGPASESADTARPSAVAPVDDAMVADTVMVDDAKDDAMMEETMMEETMMEETMMEETMMEETMMEETMMEETMMEETMMEETMMEETMMEETMMEETATGDAMMGETMMDEISDSAMTVGSGSDDMAAVSIVQISIPEGTGIPGCEADDACFDPFSVTINAGDTVVWTNDDVVAHMVNAGDILADPSAVGFDYPNGFDSGLMMSDDEFEWTFDEPGEYPYLCQLHPWMVGTVTVN